jgi:hypothetical protein
MCGVSTLRPDDPASFHAADASIAARSVGDGRVPIHAATVEIAGVVIALAGQSGSGKSTLAAAAVIGGHRFVAEEITAVSPHDCTVTPYHRPIGLRAGGSDALGVPFPDERRGIPGAVHPFPVEEPSARSDGGILSMIVLVRWSPGHPPPPERVEPAAALAELAQHIVVDDAAIEGAFRGLESLVREIRVMLLVYDDPFDGVRRLEELAAACRA